jgi:hypothetical protein
MNDANFEPWWEQVNKFESQEEREEILDSVRRYGGIAWMRPNYTRTAKMLGAIAGYKSRKFAQPKSHSGKQE